ncbi:MAG: (d)CMP kinase [Acidimicrobiia bacterium]
MDGPGGSGKSTVSRRLAKRLGWLHLDTGAFYRAATLAVLDASFDPEDRRKVIEVVSYRRYRQDDGRMYLDDVDVTVEIRTPEVTAAVSAVSAIPEVRRIMVDHQRSWVADRDMDVVVEGRDIGTVVFPHADLKVWLSASAGERARRRALQMGQDPRLVENELARRDRADSQRKVSPQKPADDAVRLDTTEMTVDEVVDKIVALLPPTTPGPTTPHRH